jgi:hypothetical protein
MCEGTHSVPFNKSPSLTQILIHPLYRNQISGFKLLGEQIDSVFSNRREKPDLINDVDATATNLPDMRIDSRHISKPAIRT